MLNWLLGLWNRIDRWIQRDKLQRSYHRSNLHGRR
jgi:hypothetical protein